MATSNLSRYLSSTPYKRRSRHSSALPQRTKDPLDVLHVELEHLASEFNVFSSQCTHLKELNDALANLNGAFEQFLQGMRLNAACVKFEEAPTRLSFERHTQRRQREERRWTMATTTGETQSTSDTTILHDATMLDASETPQRGVLTKRQSNKRKEPLPKEKKRPHGKVVFDPLPIVETLPAKYHGYPHRSVIDSILKKLHESKEGLYLHNVVLFAHVPKHRCTEYLNALVQTGDVTKLAKKGILYQLNPEKYPWRRF